MTFDIKGDFDEVDALIEVKLLGNIYQDHVKGTQANDAVTVRVVTENSRECPNDSGTEKHLDSSMDSRMVIPINVTV